MPPTEEELAQLAELARRLRLRTMEMIRRARSSHVGSCFSMAELMAALYGGGILRIDPEDPGNPGRDRFILSKGHACAIYYAMLAERGFFPEDWLERFYSDGGELAGHATHKGVPGVEVSTGSLGHGLPIGCGMALAAKRSGMPYRTIVLLGDGECDEGTIWESALIAAQHRLDNLTVIVDFNKIQSLGHVREVLDLGDLAGKWQRFGWETREVDGHDLGQILDAMRSLPFEPGKPSCLVAHTVKGKGVSFMEDRLLWHYRTPAGEEYEAARIELEASA
ncbi:transketolase [Tautonia sociabilis]|uniref:Transketolase n=1 Tax=Tautonia sociabilis TaxID=2080755 RepID=A0A432MJQ0_9BACT|nr:transketolase [Tautonia sociabilis]RUL87632.1 transketolase [Tautonia sociabilis]